MSEEMVLEQPKAKKAAPKKYRVVIHSGEEGTDKGDVVLVHNFKQILIQRDQEVELGEEFLEVLKHSVIHTTAKNDKNEEVPIRIPRFSFTVEAV